MEEPPPWIKLDTKKTNWKQQSYFVYFRRENGNLRSYIIPRIIYDKTVKNAQQELRERQLLARWNNPQHSAFENAIQASRYWQNRLRGNRENARKLGLETTISELNRKMYLEVQDMQRVYLRYNQLLKEIADNQSKIAAIQTLSTLNSILSNAAQISESLSTSASPSDQLKVQQAELDMLKANDFRMLKILDALSKKYEKSKQNLTTYQITIENNFKVVAPGQSSVKPTYPPLSPYTRPTPPQ